MIELRDIEKTYRSGEMATPVLKGLSFTVQPGEYVAIMGPSGSGKTTLMNILGCLDKPTGGSYKLDGVEAVSLDDDKLSALRNSRIGFVFQLFHLLERTSALENVMLPLIYAEHYPPDAEPRARRALEAVGLSERMNYKPNELSGGEQQRVAIARALICDPALILADEPTGNLDSASGSEVLAIFDRLHGEGRTIVMITHDQSVAERAGRILTLRDGRITGDRIVGPAGGGNSEVNG
ncbi:ABC transporter ATP-binding protein [bacterium]|nr:ABC transporter ATP-binding protein [bacterium]